MSQAFQDLKIFDRDDFPKYLPKLNALYDDLFSAGKGFRSKLIQTIGKHLNLSDRHTRLLAQTIEFIHNASLLHDDLIDRSPLRRSKTAAWLKYSPEYAVLAGDTAAVRSGPRPTNTIMSESPKRARRDEIQDRPRTQIAAIETTASNDGVTIRAGIP